MSTRKYYSESNLQPLFQKEMTWERVIWQPKRGQRPYTRLTNNTNI